MAFNKDNALLDYYHRELSYLRIAGDQFSKAYPKVAQRLELNQGESKDPHVERLLESFAFLTAKLSREIDDRLPELGAAILNILHPEMVAPIPAMTIAHFKADPSKGKMTTGHLLPKGTKLFTYTGDNLVCRFQSTYDLTLWPAEIQDVEFARAEWATFQNQAPQSNWYIRLKLQGLGVTFKEMQMDKLTIHLAGDKAVAFSLYESIFCQKNTQVMVSKDGGKTLTPLPPNSLRPKGFEDNEGAIPIPSFAHRSYRLLQEYFHFPEKFLFFDLANLSVQDVGSDFEIWISMGKTDMINSVTLTKENFLLGCTPIINLFRRTTDPIRLDHKSTEYLLVPDQRRERTLEVHSILSVDAVEDNTALAQHFAPYFSLNHLQERENASQFWYMTRRPSLRPEVPGTDVFLSFVDLNFDPTTPPVQSIYADTFCTNRFLSSAIPAGAELQVEDQTPASIIKCLSKPTEQVYSPTDGESLWMLVSLLSVNHLTFTAGDQSVKTLKETLRLHAGPRSGHFQEIEGIKYLDASLTTRRIGDQAWRGFVRGINLKLGIDDRVYSGNNAFLLACIIREFMALQGSINSFVELVLMNTNDNSVWMRWPPKSGIQELL